MKRHGLTGFTLIELMIVVVVIALLTVVAYPSYMGHVQKSKRAEGKTALLKVAQMQERYYSDKGAYLADPAPLFGLKPAETVYSSENPANPDKNNAAGKGNAAYKIVAAPATADCPLNACFLIVATPNPDAPFTDADCGSLTITSNGTRCWTTEADPVGAAAAAVVMTCKPVPAKADKCKW